MNKQVSLDDCWLWAGTVGWRGYGVLIKFINARTTTFMAHRLSYETFVGEIPNGLTIDHLCLNKLCINPSHLEPVTQAENSKRRWGAIGHGTSTDTHCSNGHPWLGNTAYQGIKKPRKRCLECDRIANRIKYKKRVAAIEQVRKEWS